MKPGANKRTVFIVIVMFLNLIGHPLALSAEGGEDHPKAWDVLQKESYYHFFLEDYLSAATRLKILEDSETALGHREGLNEIHLLLGSLYLAWGMHRSATELFNELVTIFPPGQDRRDLLLTIQKMQYDLSLYTASLKTYDHLATEERYTGIDRAVYFAGMSHFASGATLEGIEMLERITSESLYFPYARLSLAKSYLELNNSPRSLQLLQSLSSADTTENPLLTTFSEKSRLTWGQLLFEEAEFDEASAVFAEIPEASPFYPDALFGMGWSQLMEGFYLKALLSFQDLIEKWPEHPYALEALNAVGHAYNKLEAYQQALDLHEEAVKIYGNEEEAIRSLQRLIQDSEELVVLIEQYRSAQEGPLFEHVDTDEVRSWVRQYGELSNLIAYLDRRLHDMEVFRVMVDHREEIFQLSLPIVNQSMEEDLISRLKRKGEVLRHRVERAIQEEQISALASPDEEKRLHSLNKALIKSHTIGEAITSFSAVDDRHHDLKKEWQKTDRMLNIVQGELSWKLTTELPGRADDLRRKVKGLRAELGRLEDAYARLSASVPSLARRIDLFRDGIAAVQNRLVQGKEKAIALRQAILTPLQAALQKQLDRRLKQVVTWIATAELSQIQILDQHGSPEAQ